MTSQCFNMVRGRAMRVTRLDGCGRVKAGACSAITSEGFVSIAFTATIDEGEEITVTNAAGKTCVRDTPAARLTGYGLVFTFCEVNPDLYAMMTGQSTVFNEAGDAVGFRVNTDVDPSDSAVAVEVWSNVPGVVCSDTAEGSYGYTLVPYVQGGVLGDFTLENNAVTFTISNANTKSGGAWGVGPYDVVEGVGGVASPLAEPILSGDHLHVQLTGIAPPEPGCTCLSSGPAPTGATAGAPGTWTPVDSYPLADFATLSASTVAASPGTAWTAGQHIVLGDGSHAHWDGTDWVVGNA